MSPVAPSMSDRDGKSRTFAPVQVRRAEVDVVKAILPDAAGWGSENSDESVGMTKNGVDCPAARLICNDSGREIVQKRITRDDLYVADGAGFTETAAKALGIHQVLHPQIGEKRCRPFTEKIQTAFVDIVNGRNSTYAHGLTRV